MVDTAIQRFDPAAFIQRFGGQAAPPTTDIGGGFNPNQFVDQFANQPAPPPGQAQTTTPAINLPPAQPPVQKTREETLADLGFTSEQEFEAFQIKQAQAAEERGDIITPDKKSFFKRKKDELSFEFNAPSIVDGTTPKERLNTTAQGAVKGARVATQLMFPLASPVTEAAGEFIESKLQNESTIKALTDGATAGLIDLAALGLTSAAFKGAKTILNVSAKRFAPLSKKAKAFINKKPQLLTATRKSTEEVADNAIIGIKDAKKTAGELVRKSKQLGADDVALDLTKLRTEINGEIIERSLGKKALLKSKIVDPSTGIAFPSSAGPSIKVSKGIQGKQALELVQKTMSGKKTYPEILKAADELNNQTAFRKIYNNISDGKLISSGEQLALDALDKFKNIGYERMDDILLKEGLTQAKGQYSKVMKAINQLRRLDNERLISRMKTGLKDGRGKVFEAMQFLDGIVPDQNRFLDDFVRTTIGNAAHELRNLGFGELIKKGLTETAQAGVGIPGKVAGAAVRTEAVKRFGPTVEKAQFFKRQ